VTPYEFAANPRQALAIMRRYAAMFDRGPILDLGTGRGHFLQALRERGIEGRGVDSSPIAVQACRSAGFEIAQADVFDYLEGSGPVAGAFAAHLVEHLEPVAVQRLIEKLAEVVQPGGRVVLVTPNARDLNTLAFVFWLDPSHVRFYPTELLGRMLESSGFAIEATGAPLPPLGPLTLVRTLLGKLRFGGQYGNGEAWIRAIRT
jgi:SAM-dependent methyltransferase